MDTTTVAKIVAIASVALLAYFLPTVIAGERRHRERGAIFALNLLLGWTFVGWCVAFVWALTSHVEPAPERSVEERAAALEAARGADLLAAVEALRFHFAARGVYLTKRELWPYLEQHCGEDAVIADPAVLRALGQRIAPQRLTWASGWEWRQVGRGID